MEEGVTKLNWLEKLITEEIARLTTVDQVDQHAKLCPNCKKSPFTGERVLCFVHANRRLALRKENGEILE